jgi:hypothetical protein
MTLGSFHFFIYLDTKGIRTLKLGKNAQDKIDARDKISIIDKDKIR